MPLTVRLVQEKEGDWQALSDQLQTILQKASQGHGVLRCIQVRAHLALVYTKQGRLEDALGELQQALSLGQAGGFIRAFVDLGAGMGELLRQFVALASADEAIIDYAVQILNAFPAPPATSDPAQRVWRQSRVAMIEPLTRRESEVLGLLAQDLSYREIAAQLVVTLNTVKKHASHVYGKLGVNNRTDAIEKAVLLQVLPPD